MEKSTTRRAFLKRQSTKFNSVRLTDIKISELNRDLGIAQTARNAYAMALKAALDNEEFDEDQVTLLEQDDNLKFD